MSDRKGVPVGGSRFTLFPQLGEPVRVLTGTFKGLFGKVVAVDDLRGTADVRVSIYGEPVVIAVDYAELGRRA